MARAPRIASSNGPDDLRIRTDLKVPVFMSETQTDLIQLGYALAQQPNTDKIRTWEMAGTSHADAVAVGAGRRASSAAPPPSTPARCTPWSRPRLPPSPTGSSHGTPPPSAPLFRLAGTHPVTLALDAHGNVTGGVRTPAVDVPVSSLSGTPPAGAATVCGLFGQTLAFTPAQLASLYGTQSSYLAAYTKSLDKDIAEGYILSADKASLLAQAQQVQFPG